MNKLLMLGNEAVARAARDAGVKVVSSYPGTPSTEVTENCAQYTELHAEWAANEKVAAEVAIGASVSGARAMCCMKHVGMNVAADPIFTVAYTGINAGLVFIVADDPGMHSSQNEQDSRRYAIAAHIPMLEPADSNEAYAFTRLAFDISEELDMPVIVRLTTRIAHSRSLVETGEIYDAGLKEYKKDAAKYIMMPGFARRRRVDLLERIKKAAEYSENTPVNRAIAGDKIGIVCSGACYQYTREALPEASILKLGMVYPLPERLIRDFASKVDKLYVVEELESIYEDAIKAMGIECAGAEILPGYGEYSAELVREAITGEHALKAEQEDVLPRPPILCPGCPHRGAYNVIRSMKLTAFGDIGCYTLGAMPPLNALDTTICMGASIGMAHGAEKARGRDFARKSLAIIGDSTFVHSGMTGLAAAAYNQSNITVLILDNSTTGMTGQQNHPATGKTLREEDVPALDLERACSAMGAKHVRVADPLDMHAFKEGLKQCLDEDGVSVMIGRRPCVMLKGQKRNEPLVVDEEKCILCGACLRTGCPALRKGEKAVSIDRQLCVGCGLCASVCPQKCIGSQKPE